MVKKERKAATKTETTKEEASTDNYYFVEAMNLLNAFIMLRTSRVNVDMSLDSLFFWRAYTNSCNKRADHITFQCSAEAGQEDQGVKYPAL